MYDIRDNNYSEFIKHLDIFKQIRTYLSFPNISNLWYIDIPDTDSDSYKPIHETLSWYRDKFMPVRSNYHTPLIPFIRNDYIDDVLTNFNLIKSHLPDSRNKDNVDIVIQTCIDFIFEMYNVIKIIDVKQVNMSISFYKRDNFRLNISKDNFSLNWHDKSVYTKDGIIHVKSDKERFTINEPVIIRPLRDTLVLAMISTITGCKITDV